MNQAGLTLVFVSLAVCVATAALGLMVSGVGAGIVGGSGIVAIVLWRRTSLERPLDPAAILPSYLIAVAGFYFHLVEEYLERYAPAVSRLFAFGWTERSFVVISLGLAALLSLTAVGLHRRSRIADFIAWLFLTSRLAEVLVFVFPLMRPSIEPNNPATISRVVPSGAFVEAMPNYYWRVAPKYYFAGMYTVALVILPALYAMHRMWVVGRDAPQRTAQRG